jgi:hypothetical protein
VLLTIEFVAALISAAVIEVTISISSTVAPLAKISSGLLWISNRLPNACDDCLGKITRFDISGDTTLRTYVESSLR